MIINYEKFLESNNNSIINDIEDMLLNILDYGISFYIRKKPIPLNEYVEVAFIMKNIDDNNIDYLYDDLLRIDGYIDETDYKVIYSTVVLHDEDDKHIFNSSDLNKIVKEMRDFLGIVSFNFKLIKSENYDTYISTIGSSII